MYVTISLLTFSLQVNVETRPIATVGIREQCLPKFYCVQKICFIKHITKTKIFPL